MSTLKRQGGWTFLGLLTVLVVAGIFVGIGFKLAPAYADFYTLRSAMNSIREDRALLSKSKTEINMGVLKHMRMNNMHLPKDFYKIIKDKGDVFLDVDYEVRIPIFYNVDAVVSFKERFAGKELE